MSDKGQATLENAEQIIERFGGIRPMANKMKVPVTTVQGWKKRNAIPANRLDDILKAASDNGVDLSGVLSPPANQNGERPVEPLSAPAPARPAAPLSTAPQAPRSQGSATPAAPKPRPEERSGEDLLAQMRGVERKAVRQSAWVATSLIVLALSAGAFVMWPTARQVDSNGRRISALEGDVAGISGRMDKVEQEQSRIGKLIPEGFDLSGLQQKAKDLSATIGALVDTADQVSRTVTGEGAPGDLSERVGRLEQQMSALAGSPQLSDLLARVDEFKKTVDGQETLNRSVSQLKALVEGMQGRMDDFDGALVAAREESSELGKTFEGVSNEDLKAAAMLVSLNQLRDSLNRGNEPFADDLALLLNMVGDDDPALKASLEKLAPYAETGVLSSEGLSSELRSLAGDIVVSSLKGEDVSVQEKAKARINEIFKVEKDGELITGTDTQAKVARAENRLQGGDIRGAIAELQSLEGPAAQAATPFMNQAQAALQAQEARDLITSFVRQYVGRSSQAPYTAKMKGFSALVPSSPPPPAIGSQPENSGVIPGRP